MTESLTDQEARRMRGRPHGIDTDETWWQTSLRHLRENPNNLLMGLNAIGMRGAPMMRPPPGQLQIPPPPAAAPSAPGPSNLITAADRAAPRPDVTFGRRTEPPYGTRIVDNGYGPLSSQRLAGQEGMIDLSARGGFGRHGGYEQPLTRAGNDNLVRDGYNDALLSALANRDIQRSLGIQPRRPNLRVVEEGPMQGPENQPHYRSDRALSDDLRRLFPDLYPRE